MLPSRVPNVLVNGSSGIAVGIATKIPPHNMREVVQGLMALIDNPDISSGALMQYIPAPDFPTGGILIPGTEMRNIYETGRGSFVLRGKATIEDDQTPSKGRRAKRSSDKALIIITEIPYQTNKASLVEQIANLVDNRVLDGISGKGLSALFHAFCIHR